MILGKHINRYYLKFLHMYILGSIALVFVDYFQLKVPELYGNVINGMNGAEWFNMEYLIRDVCIPLAIIMATIIVGRFLWRICFFGSAVKIETDLRNRMFEHARLLSNQYYQVNKVGNLMSLFTNDLDTIQECMGDGVLMFVDALFLGILALSKMWKMDKVLTGFALIPMALMLIIGTIVGKSMTKRWDIRQQAFSDLSDFSQESFSGFAVIKAFVKELKELAAFRKLNVQNEDANVSYTKISVMLNILITLLVESVICVILGYGGYLVYTGKFNAGKLVEYIGYFSSIVWPIMAISMLIEKTSRGKASLKRVSELLDAEINVTDAEDAQDITSLVPGGTVRGGIEFRNLSFRYPDGENEVLTNCSFTINPGESVGIVGKTGSGKTTIVDLILRTYNVPDGSIFIDGQDINRLTIRSLRNCCAYVPQDNFLFSDTIARNIGFAFDDADEAAVKNAAVLSDVDSNIMEFKEGYNTILGERGVTVSGGQKQRISIARALMKDAPILIMDDSVSAVDTNTEKVILRNLRENRAGKTTILIAHRITTIESMDKIIFVDDGRILAVGSHDELVRSCPEYSRMVELQKLENEAGGAENA